MNKKIQLTIVSQEKKLVSTQVDTITAPASEGEVTILPKHIPFLSRLNYGELIYREGAQTHSLVISKGLINVQPDNKVMVIVDAAKYVRDLSIEKAHLAIKSAQETMNKTVDQRELILAEASLKQAMWELRIAQKTKKSQI